MVALKNIQTICASPETNVIAVFPDTTQYALADNFNHFLEIRTIPGHTLIDKRPLPDTYPDKNVTAIRISDDNTTMAVNFSDGEEVCLLDVSSIPIKHSDKLALFDYSTYGVAIS